MSQITKNIYLGNYPNLFNSSWFKNHNIKIIIDLIRYPNNMNPNPQMRNSNIQYYHFPLVDSPEENAFRYYPKIYQIMRMAEAQNKNVYIHCFAGISRSSTMVIAYLMHKHHKPLADIYRYVQSKRNIVQPNSGFMKQLKNWERYLRIH